MRNGTAAAAAACVPPPPSLERLAHVCTSMREALGLDAAPDKPLAWRHAGKPSLPRSMVLLRAGIRLRRLARVLGAGECGLHTPGGAIADVDAAGVPLQEMLQVW